MKLILGIFFLILFNIAHANEVIEIPLYENYYLKTETNATIISDPKSPVKLKKIDSQTYEVSMNQSLGKTTIVVVESTGVRNILVKGKSYDSDNSKKNQDKRLMKGYVRYSDRLSKNLTQKTETRFSNFAWNNQLWLTDIYSFSHFIDYRNSHDKNDWVLNDYYLRFSKDYKSGNQYYLHYGTFSELIDRPYGFLPTSYRGFIFSYNALSWVDISLWTGKNKDFDKLPSSQGINIDFNHFGLGYAENSATKVYNAHTNFNLGEYLSSNTSVSSEGNTYVVSNEELFTVPKDYQYLGLKYLQYSLGYVPQYSFGLNDVVQGEREEHRFQAHFTNQDLQKKLEQSEIELIPGILSSMFSYNFAKFGLYQRDFYSLNTIYNTTYLFSGLWTSYEKSFLLDQPSESLFIRPYLELFFSGEANKGFSLRNSHSFSYKKSGKDILQEYNTQSSAIGLYYSQLGYRYGVFAGSGQDNLSSLTNTAESSSYLYGLDFNYRKKKLIYNLNYTHTLVKDTPNYSDLLKGSLTYSNREHQVGMTLSYKKNHSAVSNEEVSGSFAYTWNYDLGNQNLSEKVESLLTSVSGVVCIDKNLNFKCDDGDEFDKNITVSISKDPSVETSTLSKTGEFSFSNLNKRTYFLTLNNLPTGIESFSSLIVDFSNEQKSKQVMIPLVEVEKIKIKPLIKGVYSPNVPISLICSNGMTLNKTEILSDYVEITKPKNLKCEESFDFTKFDENIFVKSSEVKNGINNYYLESSYKQIKGQVLFGEKPVKTSIMMNNQVILTDESGRFIEVVDGKDPVFRFSKPNYECKTSPSYDLLYSTINKYVSVIIRCNKK